MLAAPSRAAAALLSLCVGGAARGQREAGRGRLRQRRASSGCCGSWILRGLGVCFLSHRPPAGGSDWRNVAPAEAPGADPRSRIGACCGFVTSTVSDESVRCPLSPATPGPWAITPSATCRMERRRSIAVFWIQRKASGSLSESCSCSTPLARSTSLRVSSRSVRSRTSASSALQLGEPAHRHLDGRHQVVLGERLDQVRHRAGVTRPLDQLALTEGGEDDDRRDALLGDALGRGDPVQPRHLHVEDDQVGPVLLGQCDGSLAVGGLPDDVVPLLAEHLREVHPDERLVLADDDTTGRDATFARRQAHRCRVVSGQSAACAEVPGHPSAPSALSASSAPAAGALGPAWRPSR